MWQFIIRRHYRVVPQELIVFQLINRDPPKGLEWSDLIDINIILYKMIVCMYVL